MCAVYIGLLGTWCHAMNLGEEEDKGKDEDEKGMVEL